jgi:hypothetical protein
MPRNIRKKCSPEQVEYIIELEGIIGAEAALEVHANLPFVVTEVIELSQGQASVLIKRLRQVTTRIRADRVDNPPDSYEISMMRKSLGSLQRKLRRLK